MVLALRALLLRHTELEWERELCSHDGVHLNSLGLDFFMASVKPVHGDAMASVKLGSGEHMLEGVCPVLAQ